MKLTDTLTAYSIHVKAYLPPYDNNDHFCSASATLEFVAHPSPELSIDSIDHESGRVEFTVKNGTMPYEILVDSASYSTINNGADKGILEKQKLGDHKLMVRDSNGCVSDLDFKITGSGVADLNADFFIGEGDYFNIKGQKESNPQNRKVYIHNGKKFMFLNKQ